MPDASVTAWRREAQAAAGGPTALRRAGAGQTGQIAHQDARVCGLSDLDSPGVRLRRAEAAARGADAARPGSTSSSSAVVRPRVPHRRRARDPDVRPVAVRARLGRGRVLPARARPVFVLPRMMTLFDVAGELPGELVVVERARRRAGAVRGGGARPRRARTLAVGDRDVGRDRAPPHGAVAPERVVTGSPLVERAPADEVGRGARGDGARLRGRRRGDRGGRAEGRARARRCSSSSRRSST